MQLSFRLIRKPAFYCHAHLRLLEGFLLKTLKSFSGAYRARNMLYCALLLELFGKSVTNLL